MKRDVRTIRIVGRRGNALVVVGMLLTVTGMLLAQDDESPEFGEVPDETAVAVAPDKVEAPATVRPSTAPGVGDRGQPETPAPSMGRTPLRLRAGAIGVDAAIVPVGVRTDRSLILPPVDQIGWWIGGAQPGERRGAVMLAGHVDDRDGNPGALFGLSALRPGDQLVIDTVSGRDSYVVVAMRRFPKQQLPVHLFDRSGPSRLVVLTCGGPFQRGRGYADNVVAYAEPSPS